MAACRLGKAIAAEGVAAPAPVVGAMDPEVEKIAPDHATGLARGIGPVHQDAGPGHLGEAEDEIIAVSLAVADEAPAGRMADQTVAVRLCVVAADVAEVVAVAVVALHHHGAVRALRSVSTTKEIGDPRETNRTNGVGQTSNSRLHRGRRWAHRPRGSTIDGVTIVVLSIVTTTVITIGIVVVSDSQILEEDQEKVGPLGTKSEEEDQDQDLRQEREIILWTQGSSGMMVKVDR